MDGSRNFMQPVRFDTGRGAVALRAFARGLWGCWIELFGYK